jgi:uncharacterized protein
LLPNRLTDKTGGRPLAELLAVTFLAWVASLLLLALGRAWPWLTPYRPLLATAPLIYLPLALALYRQEPFARYGLCAGHVGRALGLTVLAMVIVFPFFALGFHMVRHGGGPVNAAGVGIAPFAWLNWLLQTPQAWPWLLQSFMWELCFVALPEEFFYRGYLQGALNRHFTSRRLILGTAVGIALPASAILFALHHFVISPIPQVLLVFFPALLFGWLREATGSLLAPGLFHAACNVFAVLLTKASSF